MPRIMIKGVGEIDVPDGMSQEQLRNILRQQYPRSMQETVSDRLNVQPTAAPTRVTQNQAPADYSVGEEVSFSDYLKGVREGGEEFLRQGAASMIGFPSDVEKVIRATSNPYTGIPRLMAGQIDPVLPDAEQSRKYVDYRADQLFGEQTSDIISKEDQEYFGIAGDLAAPLGIPTALKYGKKAFDAATTPSEHGQLNAVVAPVLDEMKRVSKESKKDKGLLDLTVDNTTSFVNRKDEVKAKILDPLRQQALGGYTALGDEVKVLNAGTPPKYKKPTKPEHTGKQYTNDPKKVGTQIPFGRSKIKPINIFSMPKEYKTLMENSEMSVPNRIIEVSPSDAKKFIKTLDTAKAKTPYSQAVTTHDEDFYKNTRMFLTEDMSAGFALNGDDIVSVFSDGKNKGISPYLMISAIDLGGRKLDNFDDALTRLYSTVGFRQSANLPFDREFAPDDWDYDLLGEPDVTSMYQSAQKSQPQLGGEVVDDYDQLMSQRDLDLSQDQMPLKRETAYVPLSESQLGNKLTVSSPDATPFTSRKLVEPSLIDFVAEYDIPRDIPQQKDISLDSLENSLLFSSGYDQIANNRIVSSINGKKLAFPVDLTAGQDYLIDDRTRGALAVLDDKMANATQKRLQNAATAAGVDNVNFAPFVMGREGLDFSKDPFRVMYSYNVENLTPKGKRMFNEAISKHIPDFSGIDSDNPIIGLQQIEQLPSEKRKSIFKTIANQDIIEQGGIPQELVRVASTQPNLMNKRIRELHNVSSIDPFASRVPSAHDTYVGDAIAGDYVGTLDNVRLDNLLNPVNIPQNPFYAKNKGLLDIIDQGGFHRSVELSAPITYIDDKVLRFNEMRTKDPETPLSELYRLYGQRK